MADVDISKFVVNGQLRVFAKPGKKKTAVVGVDSARHAIVIEVGAQAEDNKANLALVKFISRKLKMPVSMKSGFASKEKLFLVG